MKASSFYGLICVLCPVFSRCSPLTSPALPESQRVCDLTRFSLLTVNLRNRTRTAIFTAILAATRLRLIISPMLNIDTSTTTAKGTPSPQPSQICRRTFLRTCRTCRESDSSFVQVTVVVLDKLPVLFSFAEGWRASNGNKEQVSRVLPCAMSACFCGARLATSSHVDMAVVDGSSLELSCLSRAQRVMTEHPTIAVAAFTLRVVPSLLTAVPSYVRCLRSYTPSERNQGVAYF